jgi:hypothetical protein
MSSSHPEWRGLLASPGFEGQPIKGVYFFAGEQGPNAGLYTTHPSDPRDLHWNSDPSTRSWVMDRMVQAHVNTIVLSYWSNMPQWSPMAIDPSPSPELSTTYSSVLDTVQGRPLVILPTIEGGSDPSLIYPSIPEWDFPRDFPDSSGLTDRIGYLVDLFSGRMNLWAQLYDRVGAPR